MNSYEKYQIAKEKNNSILCVGLDTDINKLPGGLLKDAEGMLEFNRQIIEATKDLVCSFKINFAFYETLGAAGFEILNKTIEIIPDNIFIIADAKRGDIGNTSKSYADSCFNYFKADAITVHPYMGIDSVSPFLSFKDKFVFLLALTSNPGSNDFQQLICDGKPLFQHTIEKSAEWAGKDNLGYVVGATHPDDLIKIRQIIPDRLLLIPGVGTQGGDTEAILKANNNADAIINVSRDIIYASSGTDFAEKARERAIFYNGKLRIEN